MRWRGVAHPAQCSKAARPRLTRVLAQTRPTRARDRRSPRSPGAEIAAAPGLETLALERSKAQREGERMRCLHQMAEAKTREPWKNQPMETEDLTDEQLAASAHVWRRRAFHGEKHARCMALRFERELRRRAGVPENESAGFDGKSAGKRRPWWRFW